MHFNAMWAVKNTHYTDEYSTYLVPINWLIFMAQFTKAMKTQW